MMLTLRVNNVKGVYELGIVPHLSAAAFLVRDALPRPDGSQDSLLLNRYANIEPETKG